RLNGSSSSETNAVINLVVEAIGRRTRAARRYRTCPSRASTRIAERADSAGPFPKARSVTPHAGTAASAAASSVPRSGPLRLNVAVSGASARTPASTQLDALAGDERSRIDIGIQLQEVGHANACL